MVGMLAFTLMGARRPRKRGARRPRHRDTRAKSARKRKKAPSARLRRAMTSFHRQRTAQLLGRAASRSCTSHLTVEVSEAASELLASRLVPEESRRKPCGFNDLDSSGMPFRRAKLTACRKSAAYVSAPYSQVKPERG